MKDGTVNSAAFTLPPGYRPEKTLLFSVLSNATIGGVSISAAGVVTPITPSNNAYVSLDGIRFKV
jgi:hypothetical protein